MKTNTDAYGQQLLMQFRSGLPTAEIIERDDGYIDTGSNPGSYFLDYNEWPPDERNAMRWATGKVLDIGCGAGRHSLYLQKRGLAVTAIDASPGAVKVCRQRGVKTALVKSIDDIDEFKPETFDTVLMLGNNFGLLGGRNSALRLFRKLYRITSDDARIIAGTRNPYLTLDRHHLEYHRWNRKRGRMPGQIRMRVRFERAIGAWFDYLFVSPAEMKSLLENTEWEIETFLGSDRSTYFAILRKKGHKAAPNDAR